MSNSNPIQIQFKNLSNFNPPYGLKNSLDADLEQIDEEMNSNWDNKQGESQRQSTLEKHNDGSIFHKDPSQSRFVDSVMTNS